MNVQVLAFLCIFVCVCGAIANFALWTRGRGMAHLQTMLLWLILAALVWHL